jgi:NADH dehydrogenase FAD-containing subunit
MILCHRYDKLIVAVGSTSSTHGVSGLENCFQLKTIADAQSIRRRIMGMCSPYSYQPGPCNAKHIADNLETASLPTTTPEERQRLLSFVVCGGGPTGVETAAVRLLLVFGQNLRKLKWICCRKYMIFVKKTSAAMFVHI